MPVMKSWLETRWRLLATFTYPLICLAINYHHQQSGAVNPRMMMLALEILLAICGLTLAGSGVKSQADIGFPEGLAGSTQFTISLPVSRRRMFATRATVGMVETVGVGAIVYSLAWGLFPGLRATVSVADLAMFFLTTIVLAALPYCSAVFCVIFVDEPLSFILASWSLIPLLWLLHKIGPAVDLVRVFGDASPLKTHTLPWSQLLVSAVLSLILVLASIRAVETREY